MIGTALQVLASLLLTIGLSMMGLGQGTWIDYFGVVLMLLLALHMLVDIGFFWAVKNSDDPHLIELKDRMSEDPHVMDLRISYMTITGMMILSLFFSGYGFTMFCVIGSSIATTCYMLYMSEHHNLGYLP